MRDRIIGAPAMPRELQGLRLRMGRIVMVLAVLIGVLAPTSAVASLSSRGVAPEAVGPRVTPRPPRLVPMPRGTMEPRRHTNVPLPPEAGAPAPSDEAPAVVGPVEAPPSIEPAATQAPATEPPTTTEAPATVIAEPRMPEAAPLSRPLGVRRPPEPLVILDPPPPPGTGMRVGGGVLIGLGTLNTLVGGAQTALSDEDERALGIALLSLGIVELGSGIALVTHGVRRARRLRVWMTQSHHAVPKTGNGMLVGGSILLGVGFYDGLAAAVSVQQTGQVPVGYVAIAGMEVVTGALLLVVGSARKRRYQSWEHHNFRFAGPSVTSLPGGMAMGMRGRF
jgi:hypothetical protein